MVTKFYRVKINAVGAVNANPKNRTESRGAADFTNHYSLITIHFSPVSWSPQRRGFGVSPKRTLSFDLA
jgi:hypothetical protein